MIYFSGQRNACRHHIITVRLAAINEQLQQFNRHSFQQQQQQTCHTVAGSRQATTDNPLALLAASCRCASEYSLAVDSARGRRDESRALPSRPGKPAMSRKTIKQSNVRWLLTVTISEQSKSMIDFSWQNLSLITFRHEYSPLRSNSHVISTSKCDNLDHSHSNEYFGIQYVTTSAASNSKGTSSAHAQVEIWSAMKPGKRINIIQTQRQMHGDTVTAKQHDCPGALRKTQAFDHLFPLYQQKQSVASSPVDGGTAAH